MVNDCPDRWLTVPRSLAGIDFQGQRVPRYRVRVTIMWRRYVRGITYCALGRRAYLRLLR